MFLYCYVFFVKNMQYTICCSFHSYIALSLFFSVYHSVLTDKLVDINYSKKSLDTGMKLTQTVTPIVNSHLLCIVVVLLCVFY